jgi:hypothetical protein
MTTVRQPTCGLASKKTCVVQKLALIHRGGFSGIKKKRMKRSPRKRIIRLADFNRGDEFMSG